MKDEWTTRCEPEIISVPWNWKGPLEETEEYWKAGKRTIAKHTIYERQPAPDWMLYEFCGGSQEHIREEEK